MQAVLAESDTALTDLKIGRRLVVTHGLWTQWTHTRMGNGDMGFCRLRSSLVRIIR